MGDTAPFPGNSFVILSVSVVGILATSLLLLTYYLFLTKCGFASWRRDIHDDVVATRHHHHIVYSPAPEPRRGLEDAAIRRIPTLRYRKPPPSEAPQAQVASECAVCLSEFQDGERLRRLPACLHAFHIDCIDAWLQATANCPLCRAAVSGSACQQPHIVLNHYVDIVAVLQADGSASNDSDALVIDIPSPSPVRRGSRIGRGSMGDECIVDPRRDDLSGVQQPMRRSMSMDSCNDKNLYLALQKALRQPHHSAALSKDGSTKGESTSSTPGSRQSGKLRRSFFSFSHGHSRSSRSAILPI
uniref:Uncharacterized protein n=1 Tax=Avena sativa TaxID=4498 RepID=A0ACD6AD17_AVESA